MIETVASLRSDFPVTLSCGTLEAEAHIVWQRAERCGIRFLLPVDEERIVEQLGRSNAITDRQRTSEARAAAAGRA
jgi:hypothetical protein